MFFFQILDTACAHSLAATTALLLQFSLPEPRARRALRLAAASLEEATMSSILENDGLVGLENDGLIGLENDNLVGLQNDGLIGLENDDLIGLQNDDLDRDCRFPGIPG